MRRAIVVLALLLTLACTNRLSADLIEFVLIGNAGRGLLPGNVTPPTSSSGFGGIGASKIIFDTDDNNLHIDIAWGKGNGYGDLTGDVMKLHLHGPTEKRPPDAWSQTGDLIENLGNSLNFNKSATNGSLVDDYFIGNPDVPWLLQGRTYINVHTEMYEFGEIRGYLIQASQTPEPGSAILIAMAGGALVLLRRSRR